MPRYIIKLNDQYLEWSTVVDAPITFGMSLAEFKEHYRSEYGEDGMRCLAERLERVERVGTSEIGAMRIEDTISCNRAGDNDKRLTKKQIVAKYCPTRPGSDSQAGHTPRTSDKSAKAGATR